MMYKCICLTISVQLFVVALCNHCTCYGSNEMRKSGVDQTTVTQSKNTPWLFMIKGKIGFIKAIVVILK